MFAPDGFVPFASSKQWIWDRANYFYSDCALPWAAKQASESGDDETVHLYRTALAGQNLYLEWLINTCLVYQPRPVYLASPSGAIMRAADVFFYADEQLSWYDFEWPLSDDELRPLVESDDYEKVLNTRFGYYFWDMLSCCIQVPNVDDCGELPPEAQSLSRYVEPFNGWSVCFRHDDCEEIEEILTKVFDWSRNLTDSVPKGRPRKQEIAAKLYHSLYPDGHEIRALTWQQAAQAVGQAGKMPVSIDTLRRGLAKY